MTSEVVIASCYNGPPSSGNGGYVMGIMAQGLSGPVEAVLKVPPPLDKPLRRENSNSTVSLFDGDTLVGTAHEVDAAIQERLLPSPLSLAGSPVEGPEMEGKFRPFGSCFVCGDERSDGDGLCIHSQNVEGQQGMVAAPWHIHENFADGGGCVAPEYIWAALDCPGYFACAPGEAALLAKFTVEVLMPLKATGTATVVGWDLTENRSGRKRLSGTALYSPEGALVAKAHALWITIDPEKIKGQA